MPKTKFLFIVLILATVVLVSGCGKGTMNNESGIKNQEENQTQNNQDSQNQEQSEPEVITSNVDISDWQTYRNEEYGFELKYPPKSNIGMEYWTDASTARDFYVDGLYVIALDKEGFENLDDFLESKIGEDGYLVMRDLPNGDIIKTLKDNFIKFSIEYVGVKANSEMAFIEGNNYYLWITSNAGTSGNGKMTKENIALVESVQFDD